MRGAIFADFHGIVPREDDISTGLAFRGVELHDGDGSERNQRDHREDLLHPGIWHGERSAGRGTDQL